MEDNNMYIDPGVGSMLIQFAIGSIAALGVMIGIFRTKIKAFFSRNKTGENNTTNENQANIETTEDENS